MKTSIQQLKGLYIETAEMDKANRSSNPEAQPMLETRMCACYIYQPTFPEDYLPSHHFLAFTYWLKWENNYETGNRIEEGFVRIDDPNPKLLCFYPKNVFEWQNGGGLGYDSTYYKRERYELDEEVFDEFQIIKRKEWYFKNEEKTFKPIQSEVEDRTWYFADKPEDIIKEMQGMRGNLLQNWDSIIKNYVLYEYRRNKPIQSIFENLLGTDWDKAKIEEFINNQI